LLTRQGPTDVTCPPVKDLAGRFTGSLSLDDGAGKKASGQVVVPRWQ
jgi:hypothetical protein